MKMIKNKIVTLLLLFFAFTALFVGGTLAWLSIGDTQNTNLNLGDFTVSSIVKDGNNIATLSDKGTYLLNGLTEEDKNRYDASNPNPLIQNLTIQVKVTAKIAGYLRVKLFDEWKVTKTYINFDKQTTEIIFKDSTEYFAFTLAEGWYYDPVTQYCYYTNMIEEGFNQTLDFVTKCTPYISKSNSNYVETCAVALGLSIQVCQANRYEALWGITEIPTPPVNNQREET